MINDSILIILPAQDFNEQEYLVITSILEKANKKIFIASDSNSLCVGSDGLKVKSDVMFYNIHETNFGGIILIGGKGVKKYWDSIMLHTVIKKFSKQKKIIGAICSAVVILAKARVADCCATCYPDDKKELEKEGIEFKNEPVLVSGNIVTGRDPLSSADFAKSFLFQLSKNC